MRKKNVARWIYYSKLSENEKDNDRSETDKFLLKFEKTGQRAPGRGRGKEIMNSNSGEYILKDFTAEELGLISERAIFLAEQVVMNPFRQQVYWQLSLAANHLSMLLQREKAHTDKILENYEQE